MWFSQAKAKGVSVWEALLKKNEVILGRWVWLFNDERDALLYAFITSKSYMFQCCRESKPSEECLSGRWRLAYDV